MTEAFQLFDALPTHIEDALAASIKRFGVLVPVTVDQNGAMLDGHHRARIADQLGVKYDRMVRVCEDDDERREIARTLNSDRRQLTEEQRRAVAVDLRKQGHSVRAIAGALGVPLPTAQRDTAGVSPDTPDGRSKGVDGKSYPARRPQVLARDDREQQRAQTALQVAADVVPAKTLDLKRAERIAREHQADQRRAELAEQPPETTWQHDEQIDLRLGDFRTVFEDIEPGTVDAIITDPPYPREFWPLYAPLAHLAAWLLKPDGVLAVMTGTRLDMVEHVDAEMRRHMKARHRAVYLTPGPRWRDNTTRVATGYKPILIYSREDADFGDLPWLLDDVFTSAADDKAHHHWGQSESGMGSIVQRLTQPGELVVDPFLGGGTTAVVCRDLGRRLVGCDVDALALERARARFE